MDLKDLKIERKPQQKRRGGNPWPVRATVLVVLLAIGWLLWPMARDFADRVRLPVVRTIVVTEAAPAAAAAVRGTAANGYVVAARRAALSSDVPGRIVEMNVREGSVVKQGDVVARLFADEYRAAWQRAEADLGAAGTAVQRAEAAVAVAAAEIQQANSNLSTARAQHDEGTSQLRFAQQELERFRDLATTGIEGERRRQQAQRDHDAAEARMKSLAAAVLAAEAGLATARERKRVSELDVEVARVQQLAAQASRDQARATLDKTDVRAPFDGVVVLKDAEVGEVVSPNVVGGSTARGAVCTMVDFESLEVQANVPETTLHAVALGAAADVFLDAHPDVKLRGVVDRIWPTADRAKATVEVRIVVADKSLLRPEYGVRVVFAEAGGAEAAEASVTTEKILVVPETAIVQIDGVDTVFAVERDVVRATHVAVGERSKGRATVDSGLAPGTRIVTNPPPTLNDGDRVRLADGGSDS